MKNIVRRPRPASTSPAVFLAVCWLLAGGAFAQGGQPEEFRGNLAWGLDAPSLLSDPGYLEQLRLFAPAWVRQNLTWPSELERAVYAGSADYEQRLEMIGWVRQAFAKPLPGELVNRAAAMKGWQILHSNWDKDVGADAFVARFSLNNFVYHVSETPSAVIVLVRPLRPAALASPNPVELCIAVAREALSASLVPSGPSTARAEAVEMLAGGWRGSWRPAKPLRSADPEARVEFFVQGDLCAYLIDKGLLSGTRRHALARRFDQPESAIEDDAVIEKLEEQVLRSPLLQDPGDRVAYYERIRRHLNIRTVEDFLGPMLFDREGNKIVAERLDYQLLASAIENMGADQRAVLLRQRRVDWHYLEGLKAFEKDDLAVAIDHWARALQEDPGNARVALLLDIAAKERLHRDFDGDWSRAALKGDVQLREIRLLLVGHAREVARRAAEEAAREREGERVRSLRARAIKLYEDGDYAKSREAWLQILALDENDSTALMFANILQAKLEETPANP